jgi:hypothetical protein
MADTPNSSGTDIASLGISVDATQPANAAVALDKLAASADRSISSLDAVGDANVRYAREVKLAEEALSRLAMQEERAAQAQIVLNANGIKATDDMQALIVKVLELRNAYGVTTEQILRMQAAQLGVLEVVSPLISEMEALKAATIKYGVAIANVADIEKARAAWEEKNNTTLTAQRIRSLNEQAQFEESSQTALNAQRIRSLAENAAAEQSAQTALNAQRIRAFEEQARLEESAQTALNAQRIRSLNAIAAEEKALYEEQARLLAEKQAKEESARTALNAQRIRELEAQKKAEAAALEEEEKSRTVFEAFKRRTIAENLKEETALYAQQAKMRADAAEKAAIEEIKWNELSVKQRIAQLEQLKLYQANSAISGGTVEKMFGSAAVADLPNLVRYQQEYAAALEAAGKAHGVVSRGAKEAAEATGGLHVQTARATSEFVVMGREISRGNYTRLAGSFTIFAQALGLGLSPMTGFIALLAGMAYEAAKGSLEQDKLNAAIITTGNYAGTTVGSLDKMISSLGAASGAYGVAAEAVEKLTASGKFNEEQIFKIADAATSLQHATGKSIDAIIKDFESLAVQQTHSNLHATEAITQAAAKLDSQYHFLNSSILEEIHTLEKEGDAKAASKLAMEALADATKQRAAQMVENLGTVQKAWNEIKKLIGDVIHDLGEVGKKSTAASEVAKLEAKVKDLEGGGGTTFGVYNEETRTQKLAEARVDLARAQAELNRQNKIAEAQGQITQNNSAAVQAAAKIMDETTRLGKKSMSELNQALANYHEQLDKLRSEDTGETPNPLLKESEIKEHEELIRKAHTSKAKAAPNDGRKQDLLNQLEHAQAIFKQIEDQVNASDKLLTDEYRAGAIQSEEYYSKLEENRQKDVRAEQSMYESKITLLKNYNARNKVDQQETLKRIQEATDAHILAQQKLEEEGKKNSKDKEVGDKKFLDDSVQGIDKSYDRQLDKINKLIEQQKKT